MERASSKNILLLISHFLLISSSSSQNLIRFSADDAVRSDARDLQILQPPGFIPNNGDLGIQLLLKSSVQQAKDFVSTSEQPDQAFFNYSGNSICKSYSMGVLTTTSSLTSQLIKKIVLWGDWKNMISKISQNNKRQSCFYLIFKESCNFYYLCWNKWVCEIIFSGRMGKITCWWLQKKCHDFQIKVFQILQIILQCTICEHIPSPSWVCQL